MGKNVKLVDGRLVTNTEATLPRDTSKVRKTDSKLPDLASNELDKRL